jgi:hypothetical protein
MEAKVRHLHVGEESPDKNTFAGARCAANQEEHRD